MAILNRNQLNHKIVEAVEQHGWKVLYLSNIDKSPFHIRILNDNNRFTLKIYMWNLTHGGKKRPADEYRIQLKGTQFEQGADFETLVLGWWDDVGVFAGFDIRKHSGKFGKSPSIQTSQNKLRRAYLNGFSIHNRTNDEIVIAFKPEFFVDYVQNLRSLHDFGLSLTDTQALENIIEQTGNEDFVVNDALIAPISNPRVQITRTITQKVRDNGFQSRILTAYSSKCAFCSIQLKLIDAAHIFPVAEPGSTDHTFNGIALCSLHHRAFDNALITINEKYETLVNESKISWLGSIGHDEGTEKFINNLRPIINVPPTKADRPNINFIKQANELRGWNKTKFIIKKTI